MSIVFVHDVKGAIFAPTREEFEKYMRKHYTGRRWDRLTKKIAAADCTYQFLCEPGIWYELRHLITDFVQKMRPNVKFLFVVLPDGYVIAVRGPFAPAGKGADRWILTEMLHEEE